MTYMFYFYTRKCKIHAPKIKLRACADADKFSRGREVRGIYTLHVYVKQGKQSTRHVFGISLCKFTKFKFTRDPPPPLRATHEIRALYECVTRSCIFYNFKTDIDYMCIVPSYIYLSTDNMAKYNTTVTKPWTFQLFQTAMLTIF